MEFLLGYADFLLRTLTVLVAIIVVLLTIAALRGKGRGKSSGQLQVSKLNDFYKALRERLEHELLDKTQAWAGRDRPYFPIPFWLAKLQALAMTPLPNAMRPMTYDQMRLLQNDNVVSEAAKADGRTLADLGITQAQSVEAVMPRYLERFKPKGQYAHYRG